jgi:hypothetical protein
MDRVAKKFFPLERNAVLCFVFISAGKHYVRLGRLNLSRRSIDCCDMSLSLAHIVTLLRILPNTCGT